MPKNRAKSDKTMYILFMYKKDKWHKLGEAPPYGAPSKLIEKYGNKRRFQFKKWQASYGPEREKKRHARVRNESTHT